MTRSSVSRGVQPRRTRSEEQKSAVTGGVLVTKVHHRVLCGRGSGQVQAIPEDSKLASGHLLVDEERIAPSHLGESRSELKEHRRLAASRINAFGHTPAAHGDVPVPRVDQEGE